MVALKGLVLGAPLKAEDGSGGYFFRAVAQRLDSPGQPTQDLRDLMKGDGD